MLTKHQLVTNGERIMKVLSVAANGVWCGWTDDKGKKHEAVYHESALKPFGINDSRGKKK